MAERWEEVYKANRTVRNGDSGTGQTIASEIVSISPARGVDRLAV